MRTLSTAIQQNIHNMNQQGVWVKLFKVVINTSLTRYLTNHEKSISFGGDTYVPYPIRLDELEETSTADAVSFEVSVANIDKTLITDLENDDILGNDVDITWGLVAHSDETFINAYTNKYQILSATTTTDGAFVIFQVGRFNLYQTTLPINRWLNQRCPFVYKRQNTCHYGREEFRGDSQIDLKAGADGDKLNGWVFLNSANCTIADINTTVPDNLNIRIDATLTASAIVAPISAPFYYQVFDPAAISTIDMDLDFELEVGPNDPGTNGHGLALMIAEDDDIIENFVAVFRDRTGGSQTVRLLKMDTGVVNIVATVSITRDLIRLKKTGALFEAFYKQNATDSWTSLGTTTKNNLNSVRIRCGVVAKNDGSGTTANVLVEAFRLIGGGFVDCERTISHCSERNNLNRFGGAPGIQGGPLQL